MMKFSKNKVLGALYAVSMAAIGTGCVAPGSQQPVYEGYLDPRAEDFQFQKEAFQNRGKVVEATFVPGTNGQMVAVYGVRDKTFIERTNDHLNANEGIYKNVDRAATLGLRSTDTIYNIKGVHELQHLNSTERNQNFLLQNQNYLLKGIGGALLNR